jgi:hypothetical protein
MKKGKTTASTPDRSGAAPRAKVMAEPQAATPALLDGPRAVVTVSESARLAEQVAQALTDRAALIGMLQYPHPQTRQRARGARTVPPEFIEAMVEIVEMFRTLQELGPLQPARARKKMEFMDAFRPIVRQAQMFTDALSFTLESTHADLADEALAAYTIAAALTRRQANPELAARLEVAKKLLGRKGGRKRGSKQKPK